MATGKGEAIPSRGSHWASELHLSSLFGACRELQVNFLVTGAVTPGISGKPAANIRTLRTGLLRA